MSVWSVRIDGLREALRLLARAPVRFALAVLLAGVVLALPLAGASLLQPWQTLRGALSLDPEVNLFLSPATPEAEIRRLQGQLSGRSGVVAVEWITREKALKALAQRGGSPLGDLKPGLLPDVLVVRYALEAEPAVLEAAVAELRALPRVESVVADMAWHRRLSSVLALGRSGGLALAVAASALVALAAACAVSLVVAVRREDLRLLLLVGADDRYVVRPFAYAGALVLGSAFALAMALAGLALAWLAPYAAGVAMAYGLPAAVGPLPLPWIVALVAAALAVGGLLGALAGRRALRSAQRTG